MIWGCLSICRAAYLTTYLPVCLSIYLPLSLSVCLPLTSTLNSRTSSWLLHKGKRTSIHQAVALQNPRFPQPTAIDELQNHISRCDDQKASKCLEIIRDEHLGAKVLGDRGLFLYCTYIYIYTYIYIDVNIQMGIHSFIKISRDTIHYIRPVGPDHPNKTCTVAWVIAMVRDWHKPVHWDVSKTRPSPRFLSTKRGNGYQVEHHWTSWSYMRKDRKNRWFFRCLESRYLPRVDFEIQNSRSLWKETVAFMTRMIQDVRSKTAVLGNGFLFSSFLKILFGLFDVFRGSKNGISNLIRTYRH